MIQTIRHRCPSCSNKCIGELKYQAQAFTSSSPAMSNFRGKDFAVHDFSLKHSSLDDDISLLVKHQSKSVCPAKTIEELERLVRQVL